MTEPAESTTAPRDETVYIHKPGLLEAFGLRTVVRQAGRIAGSYWRGNSWFGRLWKGAAVLAVTWVVGGLVAAMVPGILGTAIMAGAMYTSVAFDAASQANQKFREDVARSARPAPEREAAAAEHEAAVPNLDEVLPDSPGPAVPVAPEVSETPEPPVVETTATTTAEIPDTSVPAAAESPAATAEIPDTSAEAPAAPVAAEVSATAPPAPEVRRSRLTTAERSAIAKAAFWRTQTAQAGTYRDQLDKIVNATSPREARALAAAALLIRSSDAVRCRENLAYRSAFQQIAGGSESAKTLGRVKTFAAEVLSIYAPEVSVANTQTAPTMEHNAQVAARAAEVGSVMAKQLAPVARIVARAARAAAPAGAAELGG